MPGFRALGALIAVACAAALGACGGDDDQGTIPADQGEALLQQLDEIEQHVADGDCEAAGSAAVGFAEGVSQLPSEVEGELRQRLVEASANLEGLTDDPSECEPDTGASGETGAVPAEQTTTTETTTTEPPPEEEGDAGDEGQSQGNGPPKEPPGQGDGDQGGAEDGSSGGVGSGG